MTDQQALDRVWKHFVVGAAPPSIRAGETEDAEDGEPTPTPQCLYRGEHGERCAFGLMIPNRLYHKSMEGRDAVFVLSEHPKLRERLAGVSPALLGQLQTAHDAAAIPDNHGDTEVTFYAPNATLDSYSVAFKFPAAEGDFHARVRAYLAAVAEHHGLAVPA